MCVTESNTWKRYPTRGIAVSPGIWGGECTGWGVGEGGRGWELIVGGEVCGLRVENGGLGVGAGAWGAGGGKTKRTILFASLKPFKSQPWA